MKLNRKQLDFIIIPHILLKVFDLKEVVILQILWYLSRYNKNEFPETETYISNLSGISRNTIRKAKEKFGTYGFIKVEDKKTYFLTDFENLIENLKEKIIFDEKDEKERDKLRGKGTYTMYFFEVRKEYNLKEIQYCFLDSHIGIFSKKEFTTSPKRYIEKLFNISNTTYYEIINKLMKNNLFIKNYNNSDLMKIDESVIKSFTDARNSSKSEE